METYKRRPVEFVEGRGALLFDADGKRYIDLLAGLAVTSVGHSHPMVVDAIAEQAGLLMHVSNLFYTRPAAELASRLHELTGMKSFFCNSGAEAIECALKLVRRWAGTATPGSVPRIIATEGGFHGRTMGSLSATGQPAKQAPFAPLVPGFTHVPYGDAEALRAAMGPDVAAVLLEPIQGEAGVIVPPDDYLPAARGLCDEFGALLVLDEIQTGLGRTGTWFAYEHSGVRPDVMCLAKGVAGGLPMGVCLATDGAAAFQLGDHASTFGGGPVPAAAALAVLDVIAKEGLVERSATLGERLKELARTAFPEAVEVRGRGLMVAVEFDAPVAGDLVGAALEAGVVINDPAPNVIRMLPPLVIAERELDEALSTLGEVWRSMPSA
jgi:acetylornithine aminotransferase